MDCFYIGRLSGIKGAAWQYTAIDVASSYTWAEIHVTPKNPSARCTSALARRVAQDLVRRGWRLEKVMTDNASEFRASDVTGTVGRRHGHHVFIRAGRPQTNGCVERVQRTILQECWRPTFARYLIPKITGLRLDLDRYRNWAAKSMQVEGVPWHPPRDGLESTSDPGLAGSCRRGCGRCGVSCLAVAPAARPRA